MGQSNDDWYEWLEQEETIETNICCSVETCCETFSQTYRDSCGDIDLEFIRAAKKSGWTLRKSGPLCPHCKETPDA